MLKRFNYFIAEALIALHNRRDPWLAATLGRDRQLLDRAESYVRAALSEANTMRDRERRALCFKALNWIRSDTARAV